MKVERTDIRLYADDKKVLLRYLNMGQDSRRIHPIVSHIQKLTESQIKKELEGLFDLYNHRHFDLREKFMEHFKHVEQFAPDDFSQNQKMLLGSYFTHEYSVQASALFNPSIVLHPNQDELKHGDIRFILSLRATGEGHISSVAFMEGEISNSGEIHLYPQNSKITSGKQRDLGQFYSVSFDENVGIDSHMLFPFLNEESMGMEDVRMVRLKEEVIYAGTFTAYDGSKIKPKYFTTKDFYDFEVRDFNGEAASNKGMALFPEKVNGQYAMIGRQDGRSLSIMYSDNLQTWNESSPLQSPARGWEMLQIGNNGSPIKTPAGWLLLTHGVGPMRRYSLSMTLLDLVDPSIVLNSLEQALIEPNEEEREGYVPNVLYTCGMLLHNMVLFIPYAMSDSAISFAKISLHDVLEKLKK